MKAIYIWDLVGAAAAAGQKIEKPHRKLANKQAWSAHWATTF